MTVTCGPMRVAIFTSRDQARAFAAAMERRNAKFDANVSPNIYTVVELP